MKDRQPVCPSWLKFNEFKKWSEENNFEIDKDLTLKKGSKIYKPENCIWSVNKDKRYSVFITYNGSTKPLKVWCGELGLDYHTTYARLFRLNYEPKDAFEVPIQK